MKTTARAGRLKVTADGKGIASHAGVELLRELAVFSGLTDSWDRALIGTYKAMPLHFPGTVLSDLAVAIADGADSICDLKRLRDTPAVFGAVASTATAWRVLDRVDAAHLPLLRAGRANARAAVWAAGGGPDLDEELCLDIDATLLDAHSEKELATPTWKKGFGHHPLMCFLDRPDISSGEALAAILREGRAGSNTTADHIEVLDQALASLPEQARPTPGVGGGPRLVMRADAAGATHGFAAACRERGLAFSFGFPITQDVRDAVMATKPPAWRDAINDDADYDIRDGAWVTEISKHLDLSAWPKGSRVFVRREHPHPGATLSVFDTVEGYRHTAFIIAEAAAPKNSRDRDRRPIAELELRHRRHARIEDRIRQAKAAGLRRMPCYAAAENRAWLECVLAAADLVAWSKLICFHDQPDLTYCEIDTYRYRILHTAARVTRTGRVVNLRFDETWTWAKQLALGFTRLREAFA